MSKVAVPPPKEVQQPSKGTKKSSSAVSVLQEAPTKKPPSSNKKNGRSASPKGGKPKSGDKQHSTGNTTSKGKLSGLLTGQEKDSTKVKNFADCRRKLMKKVVKSLTESYQIAAEQAEQTGTRMESAICKAIDEDSRIADTDTALRCYSNKMIELINEIKGGTVELQKFISKQEENTK